MNGVTLDKQPRILKLQLQFQLQLPGSSPCKRNSQQPPPPLFH